MTIFTLIQLKTSGINIKQCSKNMKLTKEQSQEIKDQQSQVNQTKRVTAPALENILYEAMPTQYCLFLSLHY